MEKRGSAMKNRRAAMGKAQIWLTPFRQIEGVTGRNSRAFTLAETLIALVVIGIIAAITVPNLITAYQKQETAERLKKTYSALSQTTNRAIADNGPMDGWDCETGKTKEFVDKYILPYLSVQKNCGYETEGDCAYEYAYPKSPQNKISASASNYKLILADGSLVYFQAVETSGRCYIQTKVDINGQKGPNIQGKDGFHFNYYVRWLNNSAYGKFLPNGYGNTRSEYLNGSCNKSGTGASCAGLIMIDGWQIKDDYPW